MKKLLVLMLVLGLASVANATLQISINGDKEPIDSEITIMVSDHLELDIWTDAMIGPYQSMTWMLVCYTTCGDISGGVPLIDAMKVNGLTTAFPDVIPPDGEEGVWGLVLNVSMLPIEAGTVLADSFDFHCLGEGDCVIELWDAPDGLPASILYDSVTIHQIIPEPASMLLLGLGGLLLRRRRK